MWINNFWLEGGAVMRREGLKSAEQLPARFFLDWVHDQGALPSALFMYIVTHLIFNNMDPITDETAETQKMVEFVQVAGRRG